MTVFYNNNDDQNAIFFVSQENKYFLFKINVNYIEWKLVRLIWIAFYKNGENDKCLIKIISKDSLKHILIFLGPIKSLDTNSSVLFV